MKDFMEGRWMLRNGVQSVLRRLNTSRLPASAGFGGIGIPRYCGDGDAVGLTTFVIFSASCETTIIGGVSGSTYSLTFPFLAYITLPIATSSPKSLHS